MRKIQQICLLGLFLFCVMNPQFVLSDSNDDKTIEVSQNIKSVGEFLRNQEYFENVSKLCHEDSCFAIDIHDLSRSISVMEEKVLEEIRDVYGEETANMTQAKGFSITKILTR